MKLREWWRADFLSARDFLRRSLVILVCFAVAHLSGLRDFTSIINGTTGSVTLGWQLSVVLGLTYLVVYFAAVLLVPIFWIAALMLTLWEWWQGDHGQDTVR